MPRPAEGSRRARSDQDGRKKLSRLEAQYGTKVPPPMPPNPAPHIVDRLMEIGLHEAAGMGVVPLSWREITAWQENTGVRLEAWEARLIRRLSADYVNESRLAEDESRPSPWRAPVTKREVDTEEARLRSVLG
ncbi:phage tail assembly chaperone [Sphingomonas sp.]|uniref:phage tail assembly chaperone n=1 Tax=Sphingomonas sp. TaxID=28214 RepID=UPI003AFFCBF3